MFLKDDEGTYIARFGTGDINVSPALIDDPNVTVGALILQEREPSPIGTITTHDYDSCLVGSSHMKLEFTAVESVYEVIKHLKIVAELMESDSVT